jgi:hypothetical protein
MPCRIRLAVRFLVLLALALPAHATTYSVDYTDQWWNAAESGWGLNVTQQQDVLFLTLFVYGPDKSPRWYVGPAVSPDLLPLPAGVTQFSGALYETAGPWFAGSWNAADRQNAQVGDITMRFTSPATGTLTYTVSGSRVSKEITRQSLRTPAVAGRYDGGLYSLASQCRSATNNGPFYVVGATTVTQASASGISFRVDFATPSGQAAFCVFAGTLASQGRIASVSGGSFSCTVNGALANAGTFSMTALDAQVNGFHASFTGSDQFCTYTGRFGGTRDVVGN